MHTLSQYKYIHVVVHANIMHARARGIYHFQLLVVFLLHLNLVQVLGYYNKHGCLKIKHDMYVLYRMICVMCCIPASHTSPLSEFHRKCAVYNHAQHLHMRHNNFILFCLYFVRLPCRCFQESVTESPERVCMKCAVSVYPCPAPYPETPLVRLAVCSTSS